MFQPDSKIMAVLETAADFIALNLLFVIGCLPMITVGASSTALYTVARRMARKEHPSVPQAFFAAFRANFRQCLPLTLVLLIPMGCVLVIQLLMALQILQVPGWFSPLLTLATVILSVVWTYLWPLQAWFENKPAATLKNAMLIPFGNPLIAAATTLLNLVPFIWLCRSPAAFLQVSFFWLVAAFSLTAFLITQLLRLQLKKYLDEKECPV